MINTNTHTQALTGNPSTFKIKELKNVSLGLYNSNLKAKLIQPSEILLHTF